MRFHHNQLIVLNNANQSFNRLIIVVDDLLTSFLHEKQFQLPKKATHTHKLIKQNNIQRNIALRSSLYLG